MPGREVSGRSGFIEGAVYPETPLTEEERIFSRISDLSKLEDIRNFLKISAEDIRLYDELEDLQRRGIRLDEEKIKVYVFLGPRCRVYNSCLIGFRIRELLPS